jgi:hypothetical protein
MQSNDLAVPNGAKRASLATWLFNPFQYVAGWGALGTGLAVLAIVSLLGPVANVHFDGVLDVHIGAQAPWWFFWAENYLDWLVMGLLALLSGKIFSKSRVRAVDALGTQALARFPTLLTALIMCLPGVTHVNMALIGLLQAPEVLTDANALMSQLAASGVTALDGVQFAVAMLVTIVMTVWMVVLMYRAWATACNFSGGKAVAWFIGLLLLAEILSKIPILWLLGRTLN